MSADGVTSGPPRLAVPPKKIAAGFYHTIALATTSNAQDAHFELWGWGRNVHNPLGFKQEDCTIDKPKSRRKEERIELAADKVIPMPVKSMGDDISEISCGTSHTVILKTNGTIISTGLGSNGRLGVSNPNAQPGETDDVEEAWNTEKTGPLQTPLSNWGIPKVMRVVCGGDHTLALATNGRLYAWGSNTEGQCGVGHTRNVRNPMAIEFSGMSGSVVHFAAGSQHSLAAAGDPSELWAWGCTRNGRLGLAHVDAATSPMRAASAGDAPIAFVACGEAHSGALDTEGALMMWGAGSYSRLGQGEENDLLVPKRVSTFAEIDDASTLVIKSIALGGFHSLFLEEHSSSIKTRNRLFACGTGASTGLSGSVIRTPQAIRNGVWQLPDMHIMQIAAGMFHSLALMQDGSIFAWGEGSHGRLGNSLDKSKTLQEPTLLKLNDKEFKGFNVAHPELFFDQSERIAPQEGATDAGTAQKKKPHWEIKEFSCGSLHTVACTHGGQIYVWGCNANGQCGLGENDLYAWVPRRLAVGTRVVRSVAAGYEHCLAVTFNQELWVWGKGTDGQLGTGYARDEVEPKHVSTLSQVVACAAGEVHSAAIVRPSSMGRMQLRTWGSAECGMLGLGGDYMSGILSNPMPVEFPFEKTMGSAGSRAKQPELMPQLVKCGQNHTAVIVGTSSGDRKGDSSVNQLWTFGGGWYGRLGLETLDNVPAPQQVELRDISAKDVSCGAFHTCMLSSKKDLYVWGKKSQVCEPENLPTPKKFTHIESQPKIEHVACGECHTLALTENGDVWAWGENKSGQLGKGPTKDIREDVKIPLQMKLGNIVEMLATGSGHTVAMVANDGVMAWGNQSCGRLGLEEKTKEKLVREPAKVSAVWCSIESMTGVGAAKSQRNVANGAGGGNSASGGAEFRPAAIEASTGGGSAEPVREDPTSAEDGDLSKLLATQKVSELSTIQSLLKQEEDGCLETNLKKKANKIRERIDVLIANIRKLPELEQMHSKLQSDLEQSLRNNLGFFKTSTPEVNASRVDPALVGRLPIYAELLGVLQLQLGYLAQLSTNILPDEDDIFFGAVEAIFKDPSDRTQSLFLRLVRLMVDRENEAAGPKADLFNPSTSKAFHVMSRHALSQSHIMDVIHPLLKDEPLGGQGDTMLMAIKKSVDQSDFFALTKDDYKDMLSDEEMRKLSQDTDLQASFRQSHFKFRQFLVEPFVASIKSIMLPKDIRQLFSYILKAVSTREFSRNDEVSVPQHVRRCEPLLRIFCQGILIPLLKDPMKYCSYAYQLPKSGDTLRTDEQTFLRNMTAIADFLDLMLENKLDKKEHKILTGAVKLLKPELLKYLYSQADIQDDIDIELVMSAILAHYDRARRPIMMSTFELMKLSNLLKAHMTKLRIREKDAVEFACQEIPQWSEDKILACERIEGANVVHNIDVDPRFLLVEMDIVMCGVSRTFMPKRLSGPNSSPGFIEPFHGSETDGSPGKVLETLMRQLDPIKSKNFKDMKSEFEELRQKEKQKLPPNYELMNGLAKGASMIDELINLETSPDDLIQFMARALVDRSNYFQYLDQFERNLVKINEEREKYMSNLKGWEKEMEKALQASLKLQPSPIAEKVPACKSSLYFTGIEKKLNERRANGVADPAEMRAIGCSYSPIETYTVKKLIAIGVIAEIHPPFSAMQKQMKITVKVTTGGGVDLIVNVVEGKHQTQIKTVTISEEKLVEMKRAEKTEKTDLGNPNEDPFLTCFGSSFVSLVTKLKNKTG